VFETMPEKEHEQCSMAASAAATTEQKDCCAEQQSDADTSSRQEPMSVHEAPNIGQFLLAADSFASVAEALGPPWLLQTAEVEKQCASVAAADVPGDTEEEHAPLAAAAVGQYLLAAEASVWSCRLQRNTGAEFCAVTCSAKPWLQHETSTAQQPAVEFTSPQNDRDEMG